MDKAKLALELEHYIRDYVPNGWQESVENTIFVPWVSIVNLNRILNNDVPCEFQKHPIIMEAIQSWLKIGR